MENNKCPFCQNEFCYQKVKDSKRYEWWSCANCGLKRRFKKPKLEELLNSDTLKNEVIEFGN